jgi:hypothetical protein
MSELSIHELEAQHGEVLPEREALGSVIGFINGGHNHVHATNLAVANSASGGTSIATAGQSVTVG